VRLLAAAALASPADSALTLMLARACVRVGWVDLAWSMFDRIEKQAPEAESVALARQGKAVLAPPRGLDASLMAAGVVDPLRMAQARSEAREGETGLSWLVRQDAASFERVVAVMLSGASIPQSRPARDRLGMRLLADRHITQGDLKRALSLQAQQHRPLGAILVAEFGLSSEVLQATLRALPQLPPSLGALDAPAALLMRWGALRREHWEAQQRLGNNAFEVLAAHGHVLPANVRRADTYRKAKLRLMAEGRFRLGDILVEQGVIDRDTLAKALAWQVDQPNKLGELVIRHRLASAERVVEALLEQARRYDDAVERMLPPVEPPPPPAPALAMEPPPPSRRRLLLVGLAALTVVLALVFATRYTRGDFSWLSAFTREPASSRAVGPGVAELLGGSQSSGPRRERGTAFDPLDLPDAELSSQPLGGVVGAELIGGSMVGTRTDEGVVGSRVGEDFVGKPLPADGMAAAVGQQSGFDAVGTSSGEQPVGSSGVTDSVRYGAQAPSGTRRAETSREAELRALEGVQYPMQAQNQLQDPIGLTRQLHGSPAEGIQVRRDTAVFRLRLGRSLFERQDTASAREEFLSAIALDPTLSPPHYYLGRIAEERGDRELAAKWYQSYLLRSEGGEHSEEIRRRLGPLSN
jgi:tetratricopeptide (TPR) repeat protein